MLTYKIAFFVFLYVRIPNNPFFKSNYYDRYTYPKQKNCTYRSFGSLSYSALNYKKGLCNNLYIFIIAFKLISSYNICMKAFYSKTFLTFIRITSIIFIGILIYLTGHAVYDVFFIKDYGCIFGLISGPLSIIIVIFVVINPQKLSLFVPPLLLYSVSNSIGNANPVFPIIFLELAAVRLWVRSFF